MSELQRGQIVGACLAGASVTKVANLFAESRDTVSKVITAYTVSGKTSDSISTVDVVNWPKEAKDNSAGLWPGFLHEEW